MQRHEAQTILLDRDLLAQRADVHELRAFLLAQLFGPLLEAHRHQMKDTAVWNIELGMKLTGAQVVDATGKVLDDNDDPRIRFVRAGTFLGAADLRLRGDILIGSTTILRERPRWVAVIGT